MGKGKKKQQNKGGRPPTATVRHPNGNAFWSERSHRELSAKEREENVSVVKEARQRVFGLSRAQAEAMPETDQVGFLRATDQISKRQEEAAYLYRDFWHSYMSLFPVRKVTAAGDLDRGGGYDASDGTDPAYIERARRLTKTATLCRDALREADRTDAAASSAVECVVLKDYDQPHLVGALRIGLNALANVFNLEVGTGKVDFRGKSLEKPKVSDVAPAG